MLRLILPIFMVLFPAITFAVPGAWLQKNGEGQVINTLSTYKSTKRFDVNGKKQPSSKYNKLEINSYAEYGLADRWTVGANVFLQQAEIGNNKSQGLAEAEFFLRTRLFEYENTIFALQPMFKLPGAFRDDDVQIGSDNPDFGISLINGTNFTLFGYEAFSENETGFRYRLGNAGNQLRANTSFGVHPNEKLMLLAQAFSIWYAQDTSTAEIFTQSSGDDYDLVKAQISGVYKLNESYSLQAGLFKDMYGANTGAGQGVFFAVWSSF